MPRVFQRIRQGYKSAAEKIAAARLRRAVNEDIGIVEEYVRENGWNPNLRKHQEILGHLKSDAGARFYSDVRKLAAQGAAAEEFHRRLSEFCQEKEIDYEGVVGALPPLLGTHIFDSITDFHEKKAEKLVKISPRKAFEHYVRARTHRIFRELLYSNIHRTSRAFDYLIEPDISDGERPADWKIKVLDKKIKRLIARNPKIQRPYITDTIERIQKEIGLKWRVLEEDEEE